MSLTLAQAVSPTPTTTGSTITFTYQPLNVKNFCHLLVNIPTASRTVVSCASSNATWVVTTPTMIVLNSGNHMGGIVGFPSSTASATVTVTFSGTPGSPASAGIVEYSSSLAVVSWTYINFNNNNGTAVAAVSGALAGMQQFDAVSLNMLLAGASIASNNNAQSYLTYDTTNVVVYGEIPTAVATLPATGFNQNASALFGISTVQVRPTLAPSPRPVPFVSGYSGMFYHKEHDDSRSHLGYRTSRVRRLSRPGPVSVRSRDRVRSLNRAGLRWCERRGGVRVG